MTRVVCIKEHDHCASAAWRAMFVRLCVLCVQVSGRQRRKVKAKGAKRDDSRPVKGSREWIIKKKDSMRKRGYEGIPTDTKYTGRRRKRLGL